MDIFFAPPARALRKIISAYYYFRIDYPLVEDFERADVGYLRFMIKGRGHYHFRDGRSEPSAPVMLIGPGSASARYSVDGPLHVFGCVILPDFWCTIVDAAAGDFVDRAVDFGAVLGPASVEVLGKLRTRSTIEDMIPVVDAYLMTRIKPVSADNRKTIDTIGAWLSGRPVPPVEHLYAAMDQSPRQVMRLANRFFGAPPKLLARKYRALRTASALVGNNGKISNEEFALYSDHSHMIREIKHFTGVTPRQLQINRNPIVKASLQPGNFRHEAPWT
jgi:AraC-like DNA-binding protein